MTILLLHSMYGRRPAVLDAAGRLRATGHEVVVPDLYDGRTTGDVDEGVRIKDEIGWAELRRRATAAAAPYAGDRLVYAGFSLGAGLAQELAFEDGGAAAEAAWERATAFLRGLWVPARTRYVSRGP